MSKFHEELLKAIEDDKGETLKDAIKQLLRHAAMGEQWAIQLLAQQLYATEFLKPAVISSDTRNG